MKCPNCNSESLRIKDTLHSDRRVFRWRQCTECKYRFKTVEIMEDDDKVFEDGYSEAYQNRHSSLYQKEKK